ncbi:MAG: signal peptidase II [Chlamydiia bacterium]|nr:signal peptidase II [Chlamydiia bacterium]
MSKLQNSKAVLQLPLVKFLFFFALFLLDMASKYFALHHIPYMQWGGTYPFGGIPFFSSGALSCSFNTAFNTGAAWGLFPGHSTLLFSLRSLIIAALIFFLLWRREKKLAPWLIATGALGNALDYCLYGHVIDFIHFRFWGHTFPIFNVADSCITLGAIWLVLTPKDHGTAHLEPQR